MLTRVAFAGGALLALFAAWAFWTPPHPHATALSWPVFLTGAATFALAAIWPSLLRGWIPLSAAAGLGALGMTAGAFVQRLDICCMFVVIVQHGYPYPWLRQHAEYEALAELAPPPTFDADAVWSTDGFMFALDAWYWVCAAISVVVLIRAVTGWPDAVSAAPHRGR